MVKFIDKVSKELYVKVASLKKIYIRNYELNHYYDFNTFKDYLDWTIKGYETKYGDGINNDNMMFALVYDEKSESIRISYGFIETDESFYECC